MLKFTRLFFSALLLQMAAIGFADAGAPEKRVALVIGNGQYENVEKLHNPVNDATDISKKLKALGFETILITNANYAAMTKALDELNNKLGKSDIGLIYFAGHGIAVSNESFLMPVDSPANVQAAEDEVIEDALNDRMVSMARLVAPLQNAKLGIVILDACRSTPAKTDLGLSVASAARGVTRSIKVSRGLGSVSVPASSKGGIYRVYATELGRESDDGGAQRNSPFTSSLLKHIGTPGISINELMIRVRKEVLAMTQNEQRPWEEGALNEVFYFAPQGATGAGVRGGGTQGASKGRSGSAVIPRAPQPYRGGGSPPGFGAGAGMGL